MKNAIAVSMLLIASVAHADPSPAAPLRAAADQSPRAALGYPEGSLRSPRPALSWHRLYFRAGAANIAPHAQSSELSLVGVEGPASLAVHDGPIAGSGVAMSQTTVPAVIVGYTLPWLDDALSVETIIGAPFDVNLTATGTLADMSLAPTALGIPTGVAPLGSELGTIKTAPLVATLTYTPLARTGRIAPYIGAGASVLFAYDARITNPTLTEVGTPTMKVSPAAGFVVQGGVDVKVYGRVRARLDVKYIAHMLAHAEVDGVTMRTPDLPLFGQVEVGGAKTSVYVNPLIVQLAVGADL